MAESIRRLFPVLWHSALWTGCECGQEVGLPDVPPEEAAEDMSQQFSPTSARELEDAILSGIREVMRRFREEHGDQHVYGFALVSYPEERIPHACLFTVEGLGDVSRRYGYSEDEVRWSYADSPYDQYPHSAPDPFEAAVGIGEARRELLDPNAQVIYQLNPPFAQREEQFRIHAMEAALRRADREGVLAPDRRGMVLMLYDANSGELDVNGTGSLARLNPPAVLERHGLE